MRTTRIPTGQKPRTFQRSSIVSSSVRIHDLAPGEAYSTLSPPRDIACQSDTLGLGDCKNLALVSTLIESYVPMDRDYPWMHLCMKHLSFTIRNCLWTMQTHLLDEDVSQHHFIVALTWRPKNTYHGCVMWAEWHADTQVYYWQCSRTFMRWFDRRTALARIREHYEKGDYQG